MTDKPLHYFRDLKGVVFSTQHPENYGSDPGYERVIPIPAALVTDELLADLWALYGASGRARRLIALRDALIAGRPKPEPLAEPTDPAVRVLGVNGEELARMTGGEWASSSGTCYANWGVVTDRVGPLRLAGDSDE